MAAKAWPAAQSLPKPHPASCSLEPICCVHLQVNQRPQQPVQEENVRPTNATQSQGAPANLDSMLDNLQADMSRQGVNTSQKGCCSACEKPIVGQVITALGKTWHPEHFTCAHCTQELGTRNFFEREGKPYCEPDYHNLFSPRCAYCNGPILDVRARSAPASLLVN